MGLFLVYILKSAFCLALFYLFYRWWLSKETFHRFNRFFLLGVLGLSVILPMVKYEVSQPTEWQPLLSLEQLLAMQQATSPSVAEPVVDSSNLWMVSALLWLYGLGVLFFIGKNLLSWIRLANLLRISQRESVGSYLSNHAGEAVLVVHSQSVSPFSWMRYVVVSRHDLQENVREILIHELAHIRKHHSWDLLLCDVCIILQWFNPAAWLLKQELQTIHEYEADEAVLDEGVNAKQYQLLIIKKAVGTRLYSMTNSLNHSSLKKRITMMLKEKSSPWARLKYLYVLPAAAIAVTAFARPEVSSVAHEISSAKVNDLASMVETKLPVNQVAVQDTVTYVSPSKELDGKLKGKTLKMADKMPRFTQGGIPGLNKYIAEHLEYPQAAKQAGKQGRVVVQFVVEVDGSLSNIHVLRSVDPEMDAAAIRVFQDMPKWEPGMQDGKAVPVKFLVPVKFELPAALGEQAVSKEKNDLKNVVIMVDGHVVSKEEFEKIDPSTIQSIQVKKDAKSIESAGGAAAGSIIQVVLKKGKVDSVAEASDISVKGLVVDEAGNPVVGAVVSIAGTQRGTVTDAEGFFTLQTAKESVLQISYIGVGTETIKAQPVVKVVLKSKK